MEVQGKIPGKPEKTWKECVKYDMGALNIRENTVDDSSGRHL